MEGEGGGKGRKGRSRQQEVHRRRLLQNDGPIWAGHGDEVQVQEASGAGTQDARIHGDGGAPCSKGSGKVVGCREACNCRPRSYACFPTVVLCRCRPSWET